MRIWIWLFSCKIIIIVFVLIFPFCANTNSLSKSHLLGPSCQFGSITFWSLSDLCFALIVHVSLSTSYLFAHCFSICFSGFSSSAGPLMLMSLRILFMGLTSYSSLPLDSFNHPRATETSCLPGSGQVHLTSFWMFLTCLSHTQISPTQYKKDHIYSLSSSLKLASPTLFWQSCYPGSNVKVALDFSLFPLPDHSINYWLSTPLVLFYISTDITLLPLSRANVGAPLLASLLLGLFQSYSFLDSLTLTFYLI